MAKKTVHKLSDLPPLHDTFLYVSTLLRTWVTPPDGPPTRPFAGIVASAETGMVRAVQVYPAEPTAEEARNLLIQAMRKPGSETGKPGRPDAIAVVDRNLIEPLQGLFEEEGLKISIFPVERPAELDEMIRGLEEHLRGAPELPGLLSVQGVTPELVSEFFVAASEYYQATPWEHLGSYEVLAIRGPEDRQDRYSVVMGEEGDAYGVMTFDRLEDVAHQFQIDEATVQDMPEEGLHTLYYGDVTLMPFADIDAVQEYNWPIHDEHAYPVPIIVRRDESLQRPSQHDLEWYILALRAIPQIQKFLKQDKYGEYKPFDKTVRVKGYDGEADVRISYDPFLLDSYLNVRIEEPTEDEGQPTNLLELLLTGLEKNERNPTRKIARKSGAPKKATKSASKKSAAKKTVGKKTGKKSSAVKKRSRK